MLVENLGIGSFVFTYFSWKLDKGRLPQFLLGEIEGLVHLIHGVSAGLVHLIH